MGKSEELKNIANGVLSSFISRNNDVNGYWGIGKIYSLMIKSKASIVEIDLINKTILPYEEQFLFRISSYSDYLSKRLRIKNIEFDYLKKSKIILKAFPNEKHKYLEKKNLTRMNCTISFIDVDDKAYILERNVWCRKHNPKVEMKRYI